PAAPGFRDTSHELLLCCWITAEDPPPAHLGVAMFLHIALPSQPVPESGSAGRNGPADRLSLRRLGDARRPAAERRDPVEGVARHVERGELPARVDAIVV